MKLEKRKMKFLTCTPAIGAALAVLDVGAALAVVNKVGVLFLS